MTIILITKDDGAMFEGETPEALVLQLHKSAWLRESDVETYKAGIARRVKVYSGHDVRTDTDEHFLEDIETSGMVSIDWPEEDDEGATR